VVDSIPRLKTALQRRYAIERELGRGGMGDVYLATDLRHQRRVAIKVLPPDLAAAMGPDRFRREIEILAGLSHPHILPLHDSGAVAGILYYVMPFVEGESLRERLRRGGQLPVEDALKITREIADALGYAHSRGVVHRDVKPENILLSGDHALLADFGIAKPRPSTASPSPNVPVSPSLTDTGLPIGSSRYMSPEQASGSQDIDARSDVYSLGCVLFEMLVGERGAGAPLESRFSNPVSSMRALRKDIPTQVERARKRAMALSRADRYPTASEFAAALTGRSNSSRLRWTIGAAVVATGVIAAAVLSRYTQAPKATRVLIARFENRTGDSTLLPIADITSDYLARGLAATRLVDEVFDARTELRELGETTKSGMADARALGNRVGAGPVVWGDYYLTGDSIQFEARILDARTGRVLLALDPVVGPASRKTAIVEALRQRVMVGFAALFGPAFEPWEAQGLPPSYEAYQELLAGSDALWKFDYDEAATRFRRAVALDSTYFAAEALLAEVLALANRCAESDSVARRVVMHTERLTPLDRGNVDLSTATCRGDVEGMFESSRASLEASPRSFGFAVAANVYALELFRPREALRALARLDPGQLRGRQLGLYWSFMGLTQHELGDFAHELDAAREGRRAAPEERVFWQGEAVSLGVLKRDREMEQLFSAWAAAPRDGAPTVGEGMLCVGQELRAHGRPEAGRRLIERAAEWYHMHPDDETALGASTPCTSRTFGVAYSAGQWDESRRLWAARQSRDSADELARFALAAIAIRTAHDTTRAGVSDARPGRAPDRGFFMARLAALRGDREGAVALLRRAYDEGLLYRIVIHTDPDFESLRGYPPFEELIRPRE
jgi:hypothetical protein